MVEFKSEQCNLFKIIQIQYFIDSTGSFLYKNTLNRFDRLENGLINYWPIVANTNDIKGNAHMYNGVNSSLTYDRFNNPDSALSLNSGYYSIPAGVYFNGPFSISLWVYPRSIETWSRIIDFSVGLNNNFNSVVFALYLDLVVRYYGSDELNVYSDDYIPLNTWSHIVGVLDEAYNGKLYVNSNLIKQSTSSGFPLNIIRDSNFIGKSWFDGDPLADAVYDDLRIYSRSLSVDEIKDLMLL